MSDPSTAPDASIRALAPTKTYFNSHPDLLLGEYSSFLLFLFPSSRALLCLDSGADDPQPAAIVKHRLSVPGRLSKLRITDLSLVAMNLSYGTKGAGESKPQTQTIIFNPPATSPWELIGRLDKWCIEAQAAYDLPQYAEVTYFSAPPKAVALPTLFGIALLLWSIIGTSSSADLFRFYIHKYLSQYAIPAASAVFISAHFLIEPFIMLNRIARYKVPPVPSFYYLLTTILLGYGAIAELNKCAVHERVNLVYAQADKKVE
ncbi:hypothetical protein P7C73_g1587, partial [Tremellales sp. Uapishka_1]